MAGDGRARSLAELAVALAADAGIALPGQLQLWERAGGRPSPGVGQAPTVRDPALALVAALEARLTDDERRQGAHYTPSSLADRVAELVGLDEPGVTVVDPACGGGALLLAAARRLVIGGEARDEVARDRLFGADVDPLSVAVCEAAIALWSGGVAPAPGHVVVGDPLLHGAGVWPAETAGFDRVVGNPPFQGQLAAATARARTLQTRLRAMFGGAVAPYVDTAALFLLTAVELAGADGRVAMVQPQSVAAARDTAALRDALAKVARLVDVWVPDESPFAGRVNVCVPVLEVGSSAGVPSWADRLAAARGVPVVDLDATMTVGSVATAIAGFRQHYYGLVGHVRDGPSEGGGSPLITSGLVDVGTCAWGSRPVRFDRAQWDRPLVDVAAVRAADPRLDRWLDQVLRPKVVVASQTKVIEAAADRAGAWVPCTPVVSVVPHDAGEVDLVAAALCSPPVAAWAARRASGTGLSPHSIRVSTGLVQGAPLPADRSAWEAAAALLADGDLRAFGPVASAMYGLGSAQADAVLAWWTANCPLGPPGVQG